MERGREGDGTGKRRDRREEARGSVRGKEGKRISAYPTSTTLQHHWGSNLKLFRDAYLAHCCCHGSSGICGKFAKVQFPGSLSYIHETNGVCI